MDLGSLKPGVMLSIARSRLALIVQITFLGLHGIGLLLGTIYRSRTPDLYENNVHNKIGWIVTWMILAQCVIGTLQSIITVGKPYESNQEERGAFLPISVEALAQHQHENNMAEPEHYRYSQDSGHFTASQPSRSHSLSSTAEQEEEQQRKIQEYKDYHAHLEDENPEKQSLLDNGKVQRVATRIAAKLSRRTTRILNVVYKIIDLTSLPFAFITISTGAVVYGGVFVSFLPFYLASRMAYIDAARQRRLQWSCP